MEKFDRLLIDLNDKYLHSKDDMEKIKIEKTIKVLKDVMDTDERRIRLINLLKEKNNEMIKLYVDANFTHLAMLDHIKCDEELAKKDLSKSELLDLVRDFFGSCTNNQIYQLFMQEYNKRNESLSIDNSGNNEMDGGEAIYLPYYNRTYINLFKKNNFSDISALAHEYGHALYYNASSSHLFLLDDKNKDITSEIIGTFFKLLCIDYFSNSKEFENDANIENVLLFNRSNYSAELLKDESNILKKLFGAKDNLIKIIFNYYKYLSHDKELIDYIIHTNPTCEYMNISSYIIAIELLALYREDKKRLFSVIKEIMRGNLYLKENMYIDALKKLAIYPNQSLNEYRNELKRKLIN